MRPAPTRGVDVALLPTLRFHAGTSMRLYASDLLESLDGIPGIEPALLTPPFESLPSVGWVRSRWIRYVSYPAWAKRQGADLYHIVDHGNAQLMLRVPGARTVVTCHDLYPVAVAFGRLRFPGAPARSAVLPTSVRLTLLRKAGAVVTDSKHTLEECRRYLGVPASRLHLAYQGVSATFRVAGADEALRILQSRVGVQPGDLVVLHVGSNEARKNLSTVVRVVARVREQVKRRVVLLKVGSRFGPAEFKIIRALDVQNSVRDVGEVSGDDLRCAYRVASVLSTGGAIPEITGGAAALYDPLDVEGMAKRIVELAVSPTLREEMAQAGQEASRRFTWREHGQAVAGVYETLRSG
ncbi:MAG: hypothetical protein DME06_13485 [Candidatus Rokuibacteriota bacterium]|nr:MAG: hypothetical protein DME06_13485 [Candidatus Rokubacteria bacterium]